MPAHEAVTPVGNPVADPIPVAPVVVWVIDGNTVLIQRVTGATVVNVGIGSTVIA